MTSTVKELRNKATDRLFETILQLKTVEECYDFFEDLCTIKELQDLSQRMEVATLLHEGQSFLQISAKTGASTATASPSMRAGKSRNASLPPKVRT